MTIIHRTRFVTMLCASLLVGGSPADGAPPDDTAGASPRSAWYERYLEARQGPEQTDQIVRTFEVGSEGSLDLSNISGDVNVTATEGRQLQVEATRRVRHPEADVARQVLDELRVEITQVGSRVEVRTSYPRQGRRGEPRGTWARVDYLIRVPVATAVNIRTVSGDTRVTGVSGEVRAEAVSGDVTLVGTPSVVTARTVSGNVTARDAGGAQGLTLGTVSGTVRAEGLKARGLDCSSVSGDIELSAVETDRLQAKSVSGSIAFGAPLRRGGRYEFGTHSGDVRITLATDTGFELDASTFSGSVRADLPVTLRPGDGGRRGNPRAIRGVHGDGGAVLVVKTFSGTVVIGRR